LYARFEPASVEASNNKDVEHSESDSPAVNPKQGSALTSIVATSKSKQERLFAMQ
jgi:hypothetical protein